VEAAKKYINTTASAAPVHGRLDSSQIFSGTFHDRDRRLQRGKPQSNTRKNVKSAQTTRKRLAVGGGMVDDKFSKNARKLEFANGSTVTADADGEAAEKIKLDDWVKIRRQAELDILMDGYAAGSSSVARVAGRASLLRGMFLDMQCLGIDVRRLTAWDAALWVRSRLNGGKKTAGANAKTTLGLAEMCTDEKFFACATLVKNQAFPLLGEHASAEPAKQAVPLKWKHVEALEAAIRYGRTLPERAMAGFFVFLVHASHRSANGQRSRNLRLMEDALMGESMIKGEKTWTKWAACAVASLRSTGHWSGCKCWVSAVCPAPISW